MGIVAVVPLRVVVCFPLSASMSALSFPSCPECPFYPLEMDLDEVAFCFPSSCDGVDRPLAV